MPKTVVKLTLPFPLVAEGTYSVSMDKKIGTITIKHEHNPSGLKNMMSMGLSMSGADPMYTTGPDHHYTQKTQSI